MRIREGFGENPKGFWWESERVLVGIREAFRVNPKGFWWESERVLVGIREGFGGNPRDADHEDQKLAPDGARMTIASGLRLYKHVHF